MKILKILLSTLFVFSFVILNFSVSLDGIKADDLTLSNLNALQASAGEAYCDTSHEQVCTMRIRNITGYSIGNIHVIY